MSHVNSVKIYHMSPSCTKLLCFTLCSEETLGLSGSMIELDWTKVCHTQSMPAEESLRNTFQTEEGLAHVSRRGAKLTLIKLDCMLRGSLNKRRGCHMPGEGVPGSPYA